MKPQKIQKRKRKATFDQKRYTKKMVQQKILPYTLKFHPDNTPDLTDYNDRYIEFCHAYATYLDNKKAAIKAGYKPKTALNKGAQLYSEPKVRAYINYLLNEKRKRYKPTADRIIEEISKVAFFDFNTLIDKDNYPNIDVQSLTPEQIAGIESVHVSTNIIKDKKTNEVIDNISYIDNIKFIRYKDKDAALLKLSHHLGMNLEAQPINSKIINNNLPQKRQDEELFREMSADDLRTITDVYSRAETKANKKHRPNLSQEGTC